MTNVWDAVLPEKLAKQWVNFRKSLSAEVKISRSLAPAKDLVRGIGLRVFGDTSGTRTAAAVYAAIHKHSSPNQGLGIAKACLAKKDMTIPRIELVSIHMAASSSSSSSSSKSLFMHGTKFVSFKNT